MKKAVVVVGILAALWLLGRNPEAPVRTESAPAPSKENNCTPNDIMVTLGKHGFVDTCRRSSCPVFKGVATIRNSCPHPVGVHVKIVAFDSGGSPVQSREFWPESIRNLPVGDSVVSIDQAIDYGPDVESVTLSVIDVRAW